MSTPQTPVARIQPGTPDGGQFAPTSRTEADVSLAHEQTPAYPTPAQYDYEARADAQNSRVIRIWEVKQSAKRHESAAAASGLAALVRSIYPDAATIKTEECDQPGCERQHVAKILGADGSELSDTEGEEYEGIADAAVEFEDSLDPHGEHSVDYLTTDGSERRGYTATLRIDDALAAPGKLTATPSERAVSTIASYRALHDDLDLDDATTARDMLTDLHRWARTSGVDLEEVFARASQVADEEEQEQVP